MFYSINDLYKGPELIFNAFRSVIFPIKKQGEDIKLLTCKQMLQRLHIALAQSR